MTTDFTAIGQYVVEAKKLLDHIKGGAIRAMQTQFDALVVKFEKDSNAKIAQQDQALRNAVAPILDKVATLALTKNQTMDVSSGTIPDGFVVNSNVTMKLVERISAAPVNRSAAQMQVLRDMKSGIQLDFPDFNIREVEHFFRNFNVFRVSWDFPESFDGSEWLVFPEYGGVNRVYNYQVPAPQAMCDAALVKLESGTMYGGFATGAKQGTWKFTRYQHGKSGFGTYEYSHPVATSRQGSMLVALPVSATGFIDHPHKLFALPELG